MSEPTLWRKFRDWLAIDVVLQLFYFIFGGKPLFCDFAEEYGCVAEKDFQRLLHDQSTSYHHAMWALITAAGGEIRISRLILHDADLMGTIEEHTDLMTGDYVYTATP